MKVGLIGVCVLLGLAFWHPAYSQTPAPTEPPSLPQTLEAIIAIEDPTARLTTLQQFLKTNPATEQANAAREAIVTSWAQLGEAQLNENNIEKAVANFRKSLGALPEKTTDKFFQETVIRIPLAISVRGYRNESVELARQLETRFAKDSARLAALGEFYLTIEAPTDAVRALESAAKISKPEARLHRALGSAYRMGLRLDDAIAEYQQAIGVDPQDKRAYYELANLYRAHGAYADAVKLYQKQLELEPKHAPSFKGLALSFLALGNESQMTAALNQARDLRGVAEEITGDMYLQTQMALYYLSQNRLDKARQASEAALMIEPRYAWARIAAAEVDLAEGKVFEAERNLLTAAQYAGFASLFFTFGKLYLSVEDFDGAAEQFAKAFNVSTKEPREVFNTRLGGSLDVKAESVRELLAREHQAAIFIANSPTTPEQFKLAESLARFHAWLNEIRRLSGKSTVTRKQMEELDRAALDFVETESTRRSFRSLFIAQKLAQTGIATGLAVELAEQAFGLAEPATEPEGSLRDYPNYDRAGRLQIFRGRALDAKGWAQYKAGQNDEAAVTLSEAVKAYGALPESKRSMWHLAVVKETLGDFNAALDLYLAGYETPEISSADVKLAVIEVLYRKVNGSLNGLEDRLRQAGIAIPATRQPEVAPVKQQAATKPSRPIKLQPKAAKTAANSELESGKADLRSVANESKSSTTQAGEAGKEERLKNEKEGKAEPVLVKVKPIELPEISASTQPISITPMFDATTLLIELAQMENLKPAVIAGEEIPPPPAPRHTRPRRVNIPEKTKPDSQ
ncbi:MAG: tetratricopeptide repeat protein [Blastocatellia bacterium]